MAEAHPIRPKPGSLETRRLECRPGATPQRLLPHGGPAPTHLSVLFFPERGAQCHELRSIAALEPLVASGRPLWLRIQGVADLALIHQALGVLHVPADVQRPLLDLPQRTRVDAFGEGLLMVLHRLTFAEDRITVISEQVGLLLLDNLLVTVEEVVSDEPFPSISRWLSQQQSPPRKVDLDQVLHYLIDELLDDLFPLLEQFANRLDDLEEKALRQPTPKVINQAYQVRGNLRVIRRQIWPLRTQIQSLLRQNHWVLGEEAKVGFTDMAQQVETLFGSCELLRYHCDAVTDAYMASVGNRMNQVMKTLAIISSIFAPLTLIAGIYGMNFQWIPELHLPYGYLYSLALMAIVAILQASILWRRGWFENWSTVRSKRSP
jgi:magnesium transporter